MRKRIKLIIIFIVFCLIWTIFSIMNGIYTNSFNCSNGQCVIISKNATNRIIQKKTIKLGDIASFSYNRNWFKSNKHRVVYDIKVNMKDGSSVKITEAPRKMSYDIQNLIMRFNRLLYDETPTVIEF